ncbi:MAG: ABC transporter substrate-binding protein, partial [Polycyclovorans sp.]
MNLGRHQTLLLRLALCMALCLPGAASAEQVLRRGNGPDVESLDPHRVEGVAAADVMRDLFEGLVSTGLDAEPIPGVAERWEISEDGLHYRFFLRHDARWSNGDAVTAMDFVVALRRSV